MADALSPALPIAALAPECGPTRRSVLVAVLLASLVAAVLQLGLGDVNLNMADEGYLWYGVVGVLEGEVPFRDFQAYDPGRYYWCAAFAPLFGDGVLGLRASVAVFQALGLCFGLLVARRFLASDRWLIVPALALALWMFPRHKHFEPGLAMILTWCVVRLLERPSTARHFGTGLAVGLAAFFGRNHGLYGGLAVLVAFGLAARCQPRAEVLRRLGALAGGVLLGYLPMLAMLAFVPGFAEAFVDALRDLVTKGANIPQPYPWPWRVDYGGARGLELAAYVATTVGYTLPLVLFPLALWRLHQRRAEQLVLRAGLLGTALVALVYLHHVSVRSDVPHLGQCIQPLLLTALALPRTRRGSAWVATGLLVVAALGALDNHTTLRWWSSWRGGPPDLEPYSVAGEELRFRPAQAAYLAGLELEVAQRLAPDDEIFIAPSRPTLYPLLGKRSPVPGIYLFWFASDAEQGAIIDALDERSVPWVLIVDSAVDQREDLRFRNTHPLVWAYLAASYEQVETPRLWPDHRLLARRIP